MLNLQSTEKAGEVQAQIFKGNWAARADEHLIDLLFSGVEREISNIQRCGLL